MFMPVILSVVLLRLVVPCGKDCLAGLKRGGFLIYSSRSNTEG
jgi:hypothetical protein